MKESTDILSEYETKLKKLKGGYETREIVKKAKQVAEKGEFVVNLGYEGPDVDKIIGSHLALGDAYAKKGDMKRAFSEIDYAYNIVASRKLLGSLDSKQVDRYVNSIEKRAERYIGKIVKNKDSKNCEYGDKLLDIAKRCKKRLRTGELDIPEPKN